eukprot:13542084-Alexandrium_andersonii.AAC.1
MTRACQNKLGAQYGAMIPSQAAGLWPPVWSAMGARFQRPSGPSNGWSCNAMRGTGARALLPWPGGGMAWRPSSSLVACVL